MNAEPEDDGPVYDGIVSRHLNRRLSRPMARLLSHTPVTPNQVSVASLGIAVLSFLSFASGFNVLGGVLAQLSSIMDGADGDLARMKRATSPFGGFLDAVLDRYADALVLLGVILWATARHADPVVWIVGFWALAGTLVISYTRARTEAGRRGRFDRGITSLASRDVRLFLVMLGAVVGQGLATLVVIAVLTHVVVMLRLFSLRGTLAKLADHGEETVADPTKLRIP